MNEASQATDSTEALTAALGRSDLARAVERLAGVPVLGLGDSMLDRFVYGTVERISPQAPITVLRIAEEKAMLGGDGSGLRKLAPLSERPPGLAVVWQSVRYGTRRSVSVNSGGVQTIKTT